MSNSHDRKGTNPISTNPEDQKRKELPKRCRKPQTYARSTTDSPLQKGCLFDRYSKGMAYNHYRPHSSLDYMAPAAFAATCLEQGSGSLGLTQDKENCCEILS